MSKGNIVRVTIGSNSTAVVRRGQAETGDSLAANNESACAGIEAIPLFPGNRSRVGGQPCLSPAVDIYESAEGLILEADLPGANESSIIVQLEDNLLHLFAKVEPLSPPGAKPIHEEYRAGDFIRTFILSHEIDLDRIRAEWKQGVLRLVMPTSPRGVSRRITVQGQ